MQPKRQLQRNILQILQMSYPYRVDLVQETNIPLKELLPQLVYLEEHGLCKSITDYQDVGSTYQEYTQYAGSVITAKGIDFITDDGGLSTILNMVTIKFDIDNIRAILIEQLNQTNITQNEKETFIAHIKKIPAKILEAEMLHLAQLGIGQIPNILPWIQKLTGL